MVEASKASVEVVWAEPIPAPLPAVKEVILHMTPKQYELLRALLIWSWHNVPYMDGTVRMSTDPAKQRVWPAETGAFEPMVALCRAVRVESAR